MKPAKPRILTINGGSSSIEFALFEAGNSLRRILTGAVEGTGSPEAALRVKGVKPTDSFSGSVTAPGHRVAVGALMDRIEGRGERDALTAVGHRVAHGGPKHSQPQRINAELVEELHRLSPFDLEYLPEEILLAQAFHRRFGPRRCCGYTVQYTCAARPARRQMPRRIQCRDGKDVSVTRRLPRLTNPAAQRRRKGQSL